MNEESRKIIEKLKALRPVLEKEMGIKRLRVYGSVARGDARPDSDVDLIADFEKTPDLIAFCHMKNFISDQLHKPIDLATSKSLHPRLQSRIFEEARDVE